jgi:hypothetical protein
MHTPIRFSAQPQGMPGAKVAGHEKTDVAVKWVFGFVVALFVGGIVIQLIIAWQLSSLRRHPAPADPWGRTLETRPADSVAYKFPRLQVSSPADLETFRQRQESDLHSYGWVNRTSGVVRIPIERAMELLVEKGPGTNPIKTGSSILQLQQGRPLNRQRETGGTP